MSEVETVQMLAFVLLLFFAITAVVAWEPEHSCKWHDTCPHWKFEKAKARARHRNDRP